MRTPRHRLGAWLLAGLATLGWLTGCARAPEGPDVIRNLDTEYTINADGTVDVVQTYDWVFGGDGRHGIVVTIATLGGLGRRSHPRRRVRHHADRHHQSDRRPGRPDARGRHVRPCLGLRGPDRRPGPDGARPRPDLSGQLPDRRCAAHLRRGPRTALGCHQRGHAHHPAVHHHGPRAPGHHPGPLLRRGPRLRHRPRRRGRHPERLRGSRRRHDHRRRRTARRERGRRRTTARIALVGGVRGERHRRHGDCPSRRIDDRRADHGLGVPPWARQPLVHPARAPALVHRRGPRPFLLRRPTPPRRTPARSRTVRLHLRPQQRVGAAGARRGAPREPGAGHRRASVHGHRGGPPRGRTFRPRLAARRTLHRRHAGHRGVHPA